MSKIWVADPDTMTAVAARDAIASGAMTAEAYVTTCLDRIAAAEPDVKAWVHLDPDAALAQARTLDAHQATGAPLGPLHGVPVGIKDIIATA
ncbi:MAG: amidase family protein, partial [Pseudomonadota bacterium]